MPITLLDIIVLAVMLLSGLLAMIRGFMREILSIAAWGTAAIVAAYAYSSKLLPMVQETLKNETLAKFIAHSICCVIQEIYESGIDPACWAESPAAQQLAAS